MGNDTQARLILLTIVFFLSWIACESAHAGAYCETKYREYLKFAKFGAYDFQCEDKKGVGKATWEMSEIDLAEMKIFERLEKEVENEL